MFRCHRSCHHIDVSSQHLARVSHWCPALRPIRSVPRTTRHERDAGRWYDPIIPLFDGTGPGSGFWRQVWVPSEKSPGSTGPAV